MSQHNPDFRILGAKMLRHTFGEVNGAVVTACTAEIDGQMRKITRYIVAHGGIHQSVHMLFERIDFRITFQIADNRLILAV